MGNVQKEKEISYIYAAEGNLYGIYKQTSAKKQRHFMLGGQVTQWDFLSYDANIVWRGRGAITGLKNLEK